MVAMKQDDGRRLGDGARLSPPADRPHLNLIEASRVLFELDPEAKVEIGEGWMFGSGSPGHPVISNAAFRADDELEAAGLISGARQFFGERGRGFSVWARDGVEADRDLLAACEEAGMQSVYSMPAMTLPRRVEGQPLGGGVEVRRLEDPAEAADYWRIAASAYREIGFPPEIFAGYTDGERLAGEEIVAFLARLDGEPAAIGMTIVSHRVAGIYWIGTLPSARGRGLGRAVTAAAIDAGFELGADLASLQASPMGRPVYEAIGFERIYDYRLWLSPAPTA
jgi:ribosomal protein S18 acetylase RimI-like enzyme